MTFGEFIAKIDGSCMINVYDRYTREYNMYGGLICTISKYSRICKLFSDKEITAFGTTKNGGINVAIEAGDE